MLNLSSLTNIVYVLLHVAGVSILISLRDPTSTEFNTLFRHSFESVITACVISLSISSMVTMSAIVETIFKMAIKDTDQWQFVAILLLGVSSSVIVISLSKSDFLPLIFSVSFSIQSSGTTLSVLSLCQKLFHEKFQDFPVGIIKVCMGLIFTLAILGKCKQQFRC